MGRAGSSTPTLTGVVYPADHLVVAQLLVAAPAQVSWVGFVVRLRIRAGAR
jgi:hypothetical protein